MSVPFISVFSIVWLRGWLSLCGCTLGWARMVRGWGGWTQAGGLDSGRGSCTHLGGGLHSRGGAGGLRSHGWGGWAHTEEGGGWAHAEGAWPCSHRDVAPLRAWLLACTAEQLFKGNADPLGMLAK